MHRDAVIHRFIAWLSLVGYAIVASGLPLPRGAVAPGNASPAAEKRLAVKDRSTLFPCMDKPCGCVTAEQCFTNCCCNTPAETLAWAQAHQIDPAVIAALQRRVAAPAEKTAAVSSCCSEKTQTSRCSMASEPGCCSDAEPNAGDASLDGSEICSEYQSQVATADGPHPSGAESVHTEPSPNDEPVSSHTLVLKSMLACGGIVAEWFSVGGAPPMPVVVAVASITPLVEAILPGNDVFSCDRAAPDAPPPRVA